MTQRRDGRRRHRDGTQAALLDLREEVISAGTLHVSPFILGYPRPVVQPLANFHAHDPVPGGMKFDLVDALSEAVVRL